MATPGREISMSKRMAGVRNGLVVVFALAPIAARGQVVKPVMVSGSIPATPQSINAAGSVVGYLSNGANDTPQMWTLNAGAYVQNLLPTLAGNPLGAANAINASGMIAGYGQPT